MLCVVVDNLDYFFMAMSNLKIAISICLHLDHYWMYTLRVLIWPDVNYNHYFSIFSMCNHHGGNLRPSFGGQMPSQCRCHQRM